MMATDMQERKAMPPISEHELREWLCLKAPNDEMSPTVKKGDDILVNTKADYKNGDMVLIFDGEKPLIRYIYSLERCVIFTSDNPKDEPIACVTDEELNAYTYIGKVTSVGRAVGKDC